MVMVGTGGRAADSVDNCMIFIFLVPVVAFKFASFKKGKKKGCIYVWFIICTF